MELSEDGLQYDTREKMRVQTLADFLVELMSESGERVNT